LIHLNRWVRFESGVAKNTTITLSTFQRPTSNEEV